MILTEKCRARLILNDLTKKNLIYENMLDDLFHSRRLNDFVSNCIIKNKIHYINFPLDYYDNVDFLMSVSKKLPYIVEEIYNFNPDMFNQLITKMDTVNNLMDSNLISKRVKKEISKTYKHKNEKHSTFKELTYNFFEAMR